MLFSGICITLGSVATQVTFGYGKIFLITAFLTAILMQFFLLDVTLKKCQKLADTWLGDMYT